MKTHLFTLSLLQCLVAYSAAIDTDADGLDDLVETGTGIFVSQSNVGTSSTQRDSDGDGVPDGLEVFEKTNPNSAASFNAFSIGLAGYYPLNGSGFDLSANSNSATNYAASAAADRFADDGAALFLNGVDNTVETTDSDLFRNLGTHATISFWCNPQSQNRGVYLISKSRWAGQQWAVTYGYNGADSLQLFTTEGMNTPGFFSPPVSVQASRWTHCAIVVEGNQCRIFLNGTLAGTSVITVGLPPVSGLPVRFSGATDPVGSLVSPFKGLLDDVRIYNRPLPASELRSLYRFEIQDRDGDGIRDLYETGTGVFVSPQNTGTSPDNPDSDGDGVPDGEEITIHQSDPNSKDSDGDGFEDLFEIQTGFNPALAASTPETLSSILTAVEFRFNAASGVSYRIESSPDLNEWKVVETGIQGTGGTISRLFSVDGMKNRYFRARRE